MKSLRFRLAACALAVPCLAGVVLTAPVHAAPAKRAPAAPQIVSMAVHAEHALEPGSDLTFTVQGTPNATRAGILVANRIQVPLRQISTGNYQGTYVVRRGDRIDPNGTVTVQLTHGQRVTTRQFGYPQSFRNAVMGAAPAAVASGPLVERFVLRHEGVMEPGREVQFRLRGQPGAEARVDIPGVVNGLPLEEVRPGVYEGAYTIRRRDPLDAFFGAVATVTAGDRRVTAQIDRDVRRRDADGER